MTLKWAFKSIPNIEVRQLAAEAAALTLIKELTYGYLTFR